MAKGSDGGTWVAAIGSDVSEAIDSFTRVPVSPSAKSS